jgi:hypothetical protein
VADLHFFGIRHHGPGSARSLVQALEQLAPDLVLIEGPPDAQELLSLAAREDLEPPVALLVYVPQSPRDAVLYPFASYSPEWQAIRYALKRNIPARFIDLPQSMRLGRDKEADESSAPTEVEETATHGDPLAPIARAAGYSDAERWWDHLVESRHGKDIEVFQAVHEMMTAVRTEIPETLPLIEQQREAYMRKSIRAASAEGFGKIAVVCGAWHTPALANMPSAKHDDALLKGIAKVKTEAAWVPWSYERLSFRSGYGAGVESPVWYELLWHKRGALGAEWLTRAARLLREEDVPVSSAHVIEACRLAETLAAVRDRPVPALTEYNDAAVAVMGAGNAVNLQIIHRRWHFGDRLGKVPEDFPAAPLQQDLASLQKRLRFPAKAEEKTFDLDLRENNDRERSLLLRRLRLLGVEWGVPARQSMGRGTFHEVWQVRWKPEFAIALIEASRYGHTIAQGAAALIAERAANAESSLAPLIDLLEDALFADLAAAITPLVMAIENRAAVAADVLQLLDALPPLVDVHRYGDVRGTDVSLIADILHGLLPRILVGVPNAAVNIDDDAAEILWKKLIANDRALSALANPEYLSGWHEMLLRVADNGAAHALLRGYTQRLLYDAKQIGFGDLARVLSLMLSPGNAPSVAAAWIEGLLSGSGSVLVHDEQLRNLVNDWVSSASAEHFVQVLPLLRRTFAQFPAPERRQIGERLRAGVAIASTAVNDQSFDEQAARAILPTLRLIWNLGESHES